MIAAWLDRVLLRQPFEGASARRYAEAERRGFGDLDERLLDGMAPVLARADRLLDLGSGPATFATLAAKRHPRLAVIAVEPSHAFARASSGMHVLRARGEALPLGDATIDVAVCLSAIRHVRDRSKTFAELRRVVRGTLVLVELDPAADGERITNHAARIEGALYRHAFGPLVVRTAPPMSAIEAIATSTGWRVQSRRSDPLQPVYVLELT